MLRYSSGLRGNCDWRHRALPLDQPPQAFFQANFTLEAQHFFCFLDRSPSRLHVADCARLTIFRLHSRIAKFEHQVTELIQAGLNSRTDIESFVGYVALRR